MLQFVAVSNVIISLIRVFVSFVYKDKCNVINLDETILHQINALFSEIWQLYIYIRILSLR